MTRLKYLRFFFILIFMASACTDSGATGPATLTMDGADRVVSAWAYSPDEYLLGQAGTLGYLAWTITLGSVPAGTDCDSGARDRSLWDDASSWLVSINIAVPYAPGADKSALKQLRPSDVGIQPLSSGLPPLTQPAASLQVFDDSVEPDVMSAGTLTITSFNDSAIEGHFAATGSGATAMVSGTFTANRCNF